MLLEQHPRVAAARAGREVARQEAAILESSPYEWTAKVSTQRRALESGPRYREWNAGIERTIRLPGKAAADRKIGKATEEEAEARYGEAVHEAARELMTLWVEWLAGEREHALATSGIQSTKERQTTNKKHKQASNATKQKKKEARAELAEQRRAEGDASMR